jgi:hypothetical protein
MKRRGAALVSVAWRALHAATAAPISSAVSASRGCTAGGPGDARGNSAAACRHTAVCETHRSAIYRTFGRHLT